MADVIQIQSDDPAREDVRHLLSEHLADMFATSPADSVHALDFHELSKPGISFWTARERGVLLGCAAVKQLAPDEGEIKSMRTASHARGRGVAALLLGRILDHARTQGYTGLYLETGTEDFFAPARRLYHGHGFRDCGPFADYRLDPHSVFMELRIAGDDPLP